MFELAQSPFARADRQHTINFEKSKYFCTKKYGYLKNPLFSQNVHSGQPSSLTADIFWQPRTLSLPIPELKHLIFWFSGLRCQGGGSLSSVDKEKGFFRYGRPQFLVQKTSDFSKFMVCPNGQGGLSQCGQGRINFSQFYADVLYGRPLTPNFRELFAHDVLNTIKWPNCFKMWKRKVQFFWEKLI